MGGVTDRVYDTWKDRAACRDLPVELFHDWSWSVGQQRRLGDFNAAQAVCWACPVRAECLVYALSLPATDGVFAGLDPDELKRKRGMSAPSKPDTGHRTAVYLVRDGTKMSLVKPGGGIVANRITSYAELAEIVREKRLEVCRP